MTPIRPPGHSYGWIMGWFRLNHGLFIRNRMDMQDFSVGFSCNLVCRKTRWKSFESKWEILDISWDCRAYFTENFLNQHQISWFPAVNAISFVDLLFTTSELVNLVQHCSLSGQARSKKHFQVTGMPCRGKQEAVRRRSCFKYSHFCKTIPCVFLFVKSYTIIHYIQIIYYNTHYTNHIL